jgi:hypothetical protein
MSVDIGACRTARVRLKDSIILSVRFEEER